MSARVFAAFASTSCACAQCARNSRATLAAAVKGLSWRWSISASPMKEFLRQTARVPAFLQEDERPIHLQFSASGYGCCMKCGAGRVQRPEGFDEQRFDEQRFEEEA